MRNRLLIFGMALWSACMGVAAQESLLDFTGRVLDRNGRGVSGVVVNDGVRFTTTDNKGVWTLATDTVVSKFVYIYLLRLLINCPSRRGWQMAFMFQYVSWSRRMVNMILFLKNVESGRKISITLQYPILRCVMKRR